MPIIKEVLLENGSKRIYHKAVYGGGKSRRRIYLEDKKGNVHHVVYGDNQKKFPVILRSISTI